MKKITALSLGPGARGYLTLAALDEMKKAPALILRTGQSDAAEFLKEQGISFETLDSVHEASEDFDELIAGCVKAVIEKAKKTAVVYAVFDVATDETVKALQAAAPVSLLRGVPLETPFLQEGAARALSASEYLTQEKEQPLLITELDSKLLAGEVKLKLLPLYGENKETLFFAPQKDRMKRDFIRIPLCELDRQAKYDHTCAALLIPEELIKKERWSFDDLVRVLSILRGENGCPWDKEQTHASLRPYLIEEAYETAAAIDEGDADHIADELGDVLLQVVFQANIGREYGTFELSDITSAICKKMIERHPHIFSCGTAKTAEDVNQSWDEIKKKQRGLTTVTAALKDVSAGLPPLMRAEKVQKKAAKVGFDFSNAEEALKKVHEEAEEVLEELKKHADPSVEIGDLLFSVVNTARLCGAECETTLMQATQKFIDRFESMESLAFLDGKSLKNLTISEMDVYWNSSKHRP